MQKWEHLFVMYISHKDQYRPYEINGQELRDWKRGVTLYEYSNQLGEEGWELISNVVPRIGPNTLIFKRPKLLNQGHEI